MGGSLMSLWHPSELVVILGISLGAFLASTPAYIWVRTMKYLGRFFAGERVSKRVCMPKPWILLEELARLSRSSGMLALEKHVTSPENSPIFMHYSKVLKHQDLRKFIVDNFNYLLLNPPATLNFKSHLEAQIDDVYSAMMEVPKAAGKVADWLPGFWYCGRRIGGYYYHGDARWRYGCGRNRLRQLVPLWWERSRGCFFAFAVIAPFVHAVEVMIRQDRSLFEMTASFLEAYHNGVSPNLAVEVGRQRVPPEFEVPREAD